MANFNVHLSAGIIGGTALAHIGWGMGVWPGESLFLVIMLTTIGGLLPDIDAHNSHSVKLIFNLFALITMVFVSTLLHEQLQLLDDCADKRLCFRRRSLRRLQCLPHAHRAPWQLSIPWWPCC